MRRRKIRGSKLKTPIKLVCIVVSVAFIIMQIISVLQLRIISQTTISSRKSEIPNSNLFNGAKFGKFGETVIGMLPEDVAFTLFLPSERAIQRDLRLNQNSSNSYAILTRILGFSAVPRWISLADLEHSEQKIYDSISGLGLYVWKDSNETVVVNGVASEQADLRIGKILVHVMDGVVMDAEFEQSRGGALSWASYVVVFVARMSNVISNNSLPKKRSKTYLARDKRAASTSNQQAVTSDGSREIQKKGARDSRVQPEPDGLSDARLHSQSIQESRTLISKENHSESSAKALSSVVDGTSYSLPSPDEDICPTCLEADAV